MGLLFWGLCNGKCNFGWAVWVLLPLVRGFAFVFVVFEKVDLWCCFMLVLVMISMCYDYLGWFAGFYLGGYSVRGLVCCVLFELLC